VVVGLVVLDNKGRVSTRATASKTLKDMLDESKLITREIAREALREEQKGGFDKKPRTRVDNVFDKSERDVRALGKIEYYARQDFSEAIAAIYDRLLTLSPVGTTKNYINTHLVIVNGRTVARSKNELSSWLKTAVFNQNDKIRFVNAMPYARKLELNSTRRITSGADKGSTNKKKRFGPSSQKKTLKVRKPNGAYFLTARFARSKFKSVASFVRFSFLTGDALGLQSNAIRPGYRTTFKKDGRPYLYPTIVMDVAQQGVIQ